MIGSLATGYGGLDLAAERVLGGRTAWVADNDPGASKILAARFPGVPNLSDVTAVDWTRVEPIDVLTAGYPCQPFSHAGKRAGADDPRNLWPHVLRAVRELRPRLVLLENVAGHLSLGFGRVLGDLAAIGYDARWTCLRAADVGAPHGRLRVFIAATDADRQRPAQRSRDGRSQQGLPATGRVQPADDRPARAVGATPDPGGQRHGRGENPGAVGRVDGADAGEARERERARPVAGDRGGPSAPDADGRRRREPNAGLGRVSVLDADGGAVAPDADGAALGRRLQPGVGSWGDVAGRGEVDSHVRWGSYGPAVRRWERTLGRPAPAPTEPGRNGPRLSPRFVEWLMGLEAGWVTDVPGLARNAQLKALGNGVVPQQAEAALRWLLDVREDSA